MYFIHYFGIFVTYSSTISCIIYIYIYMVLNHLPHAAIAAAIFASCSSSNTAADPESVATIDLTVPSQYSGEPLAADNLAAVVLDSEKQEAFFSRAVISDVIGDTILIHENGRDSRVIEFSTSTGKYLGQINHRGQGPEEYRVMLSAIADPSTGTLLIPLIDRPAVLAYTLATDSFAGEKSYIPAMRPSPALGGVSSCINIPDMRPEGLIFMQYDGNFASVDSIVMEGFIPGNVSTYMGTADNKGVIMVADTLYNIMPGHLEQAVILSRGDKGITFDQEGDIMRKAIQEGADETELMKPYIIVRDIQTTGNHIAVTTMRDGAKTTAIYRLSDGSLLYSNTYPDLSKKSCLTVNVDGKPVAVENIFARNGHWYGLADESADGSTNNILVSFTLHD